MRVALAGRKGDDVIRREWRLVAEAGDGPWIPAVAARAILRSFQEIPPGARPALAEVPLVEIERAMEDLAVAAGIETEPATPLFQAALGDRWHDLSPEARAVHEIHDVKSCSETARGGVRRNRTSFHLDSEAVLYAARRPRHSARAAARLARLALKRCLLERLRS